MTIEIVWGSGEGTTKLNAFDTALKDAGIHNYNHIQLSSVIPKNEEIEIVGKHDEKWDVGEFTATVITENVSSTNGKNISCGIGWAMADEGGVFYEEHGDNPDNVKYKIKEGIKGAKDIRENWNWNSDINTRIIQYDVEKIGAVVMAAIYNPVKQK